jgi:hypothetical protein
MLVHGRTTYRVVLCYRVNGEVKVSGLNFDEGAIGLDDPTERALRSVVGYDGDVRRVGSIDDMVEQIFLTWWATGTAWTLRDAERTVEDAYKRDLPT